MDAEYLLNKSVPQIRIHPEAKGVIEKGYHFYKPNMVTVSKVGLFMTYIRSRIANNSHCTCHIFMRKVLIAKGFIPKGTVYYLNSKGEGVAEQICLTEMTKL